MTRYFKWKHSLVSIETFRAARPSPFHNSLKLRNVLLLILLLKNAANHYQLALVVAANQANKWKRKITHRQNGSLFKLTICFDSYNLVSV